MRCIPPATTAAGRGFSECITPGSVQVEALERLTDYMDGHIRYEEEVTMPWLKSPLPINPVSP